MRPVNNKFPSSDQSFNKERIPYLTMQDGLIDTIGSYCSICEKPIFTDDFFLDSRLSRHILLRDIRKDDWDLILLSCFECKTQKKSTKDITRSNYMDYVWPFDLNYIFNLYNDNSNYYTTPFAYTLKNVNILKLSFSEELLIVETNPVIIENSIREKALNTIELYQLNTRYYDNKTNTLTKTPEEVRQQDTRLFYRTEAWKEAKQIVEDTDIKWACSQFGKNSDNKAFETTLNFVSKMAKKTGFWSVWMTVFWQEFKNPYLLHELFVETIRRPGDIVPGYQGIRPPTPDVPLTSGRRPDSSTSNVTYLHFPGTAIDRIFYRP